MPVAVDNGFAVDVDVGCNVDGDAVDDNEDVDGQDTPVAPVVVAVVDAAAADAAESLLGNVILTPL